VSKLFFTFVAFSGKCFGLVTDFVVEHLLSNFGGGEFGRTSLFERILLLFLR
jgi:hypothetical protein